jgi:hypothetical protein
MRRLFEVWMLFTLESLRCAGCIPSVIHARFKHLGFDDLAALDVAGMVLRGAASHLPFYAGTFFRATRLIVPVISLA